MSYGKVIETKALSNRPIQHQKTSLMWVISHIPNSTLTFITWHIIYT